MDGCSLFALIACFNWSGFYVDGGLLYQDSGVEQIKDTSTYRWIPGDQNFELDSRSHRASHTAENPYGQLTIGYELRFTNITWGLEATHTSSIATGRDRGVNSISLRARWYPFR